ncbi:MAG: glycosyltransferase [Pacificimonas sp.]
MTAARILFVINSLTGGGAERVFTTVLQASGERLARYGVEVALLDDEEEAYRLPDGLKVHRLASGSGLIASVRKLDALVATRRPDLILSFLTRANVATVIAARRHSAQAILSERVNTSAHLSSGRFAVITRTLVRLTYGRADHIIAVSEGVAATLVQDFAVPAAKITAIPNPVDAAAIHNAADAVPEMEVTATDIVAMGRLVPNKNFALAIRAFAASAWPGRLIILGKGPERELLMALGRKLRLGDRLVMPGFVANPYAVISRAGVFLLSSRAEGFSNALVEAMAAGTAVVSTDCPSGPALIMEKCSDLRYGVPTALTGGYLVRMEDEKAMTAAIDAMRDDHERAHFAADGRRRVGAFSVERAADAYWSVIDNAIRKRAVA